MASTDVVFIVRSDGIAALMGSTGDVGRWMNRRSQAITLRSRRYVNSRTGNLASTIHTTAVRHNMPFQCFFDVRAEADYALYVHEGTLMVAPIRSNRAVDARGRAPGKMIVRPAPHSRYAVPTPRVEVRGQRANRYLVKGMAYALRNETRAVI